MTRKYIAIVILAAFISTSVQAPSLAQTVDPLPRMPAPGVMVHLSPEYTPAYLKGIVIHPENALKFDFIIYKGDKELTDSQKRQEYTKLSKYFLASLAIPDDDQWVNLSPYEKDRIIKDDFGKTEMGRDLLAQDYLLKQITASLIYPGDHLGREFWDRVYAQAQKQYGTSDIPINTFNKVWILPDDALIYEKGNTAYVLRNHLKVMLEEDYLSLQKHSGIQSAPVNKTHNIASKIVREIVLPELEREVNEDKNFATVRQVYSGMLLAAWYKRALKESLLSKIYANKGRVKGVDSDPRTNEKIYQQYLRAYKKGVFNFIKEDVDKYTNEVIPRKYFSGGAVGYETHGMSDFAQVVRIEQAMTVADSAQVAAEISNDDLAQITAKESAEIIKTDANAAMKSSISLSGNIEVSQFSILSEIYKWKREDYDKEAHIFYESNHQDYDLVVWSQFASNEFNVGIRYKGLLIPFIQLEQLSSQLIYLQRFVTPELFTWFLRVLSEDKQGGDLEQFLRIKYGPEFPQERSIIGSSYLDKIKDVMEHARQIIVKIQDRKNEGDFRDRGSGFITKIDGQYYIVTAAHVIQGSHQFRAVTSDQKIIDLDLIGTARNGFDVALFKLPKQLAEGFPTLPVVKRFYTGNGGPAIDFGYHGSSSIREERDKISGVWAMMQAHLSTYTFLNKPTPGGMSGGPLVNLQTKEIIAINSTSSSKDSKQTLISEQMIREIINVDAAMNVRRRLGAGLGALLMMSQPGSTANVTQSNALNPASHVVTDVGTQSSYLAQYWYDHPRIDYSRYDDQIATARDEARQRKALEAFPQEYAAGYVVSKDGETFKGILQSHGIDIRNTAELEGQLRINPSIEGSEKPLDKGKVLLIRGRVNAKLPVLEGRSLKEVIAEIWPKDKQGQVMAAFMENYAVSDPSSKLARSVVFDAVLTLPDSQSLAEYLQTHPEQSVEREVASFKIPQTISLGTLFDILHFTEEQKALYAQANGMTEIDLNTNLQQGEKVNLPDFESMDFMPDGSDITPTIHLLFGNETPWVLGLLRWANPTVDFNHLPSGVKIKIILSTRDAEIFSKGLGMLRTTQPAQGERHAIADFPGDAAMSENESYSDFEPSAQRELVMQQKINIYLKKNGIGPKDTLNYGQAFQAATWAIEQTRHIEQKESPLFEDTMKRLLTEDQIEIWKARFKHFDSLDLIMILQRVHSVSEKLSLYGLRKETFGEGFLLDKLMVVFPFSNALIYRILQRSGLMGPSWDAIKVDRQTLNLLKQGDGAKVLSQLGGKGIGAVLPQAKAFLDYFDINIQDMEFSALSTWLITYANDPIERMPELKQNETLTSLATSFKQYFFNDLIMVLSVMKPGGGLLPIKLFSRGADGIVIKILVSNGQVDVLKINVPQGALTNEEFERNLKEVVSKTKGHPGIVKNFGVFPAVIPSLLGNKQVVLEFNEFIDGENLRAAISQGQLKLNTVLKLLLQFIEIHRFLDEQGLVNRDAKNLNNLVVDHQGKAVLVDLGNVMSKEVYLHEYKGIIAEPSLLRIKQELITAIIRFLTGIQADRIDYNGVISTLEELSNSRFIDAKNADLRPLYGLIVKLGPDQTVGVSELCDQLEKVIKALILQTDAAMGSDDSGKKGKKNNVVNLKRNPNLDVLRQMELHRRVLKQIPEVLKQEEAKRKGAIISNDNDAAMIGRGLLNKVRGLMPARKPAATENKNDGEIKKINFDDLTMPDRVKAVDIYRTITKMFLNYEFDHPGIFALLALKENINKPAVLKTSEYGELLIKERLMDKEGNVDELVKKVVAATLVGEGMQTKLVVPFKSDLLGTGDHAMKGGIDFNAAHLKLQIRRDGRGVPLPVGQQDLENIHIDGLVPVIISIRPAVNSSLLSDLQINSSSPV